MTPHTAILEQLVLGLLRRRIKDAGAEASLEAAVQAARDVLGGEDLAAEEQSALEACYQEDIEDPNAIVLGHRIARALRAGLEAANVDSSNVPEILVLRQPGKVQMMGAVTRIQAQIAARMKGEKGGLLLVAANQLFQKIKRLVPASEVEGKPTIQYHEDVLDEAGTTTGIEVFSADVSHETLERTATARLASLKEDSVSDDSVKAAWVAGAGNTDGSAPASSGITPPLQAQGKMGDAEGQAPSPSLASISSAEIAEAAAQAQKDADPLIGQLFHLKYRIVRRLGSGGFGSVYEAQDERGAGNRVAIKVLSGKAAASVAQQQSFKDEARRVTRLSHPNIVDWKVFDETEDGTPYFVMELVEGEEFEETLKRERKIAPDRAARMLLQILDALRAAHHLSKRESILHLDLKPANLFRVPPRENREEQVKVIDFGIGQYIGGAQVQDNKVVPMDGEAPAELGELSTLTFARPKGSSTTTGGVTRSRGCTPEYASPEQCDHVLDKPEISALDGRSDLYSLGVVGFEMLTGQLPFKAKTRLDVMRMHQEDTAPKVGSMGVRIPRRLATFIDRCLQKDPAQRWKDTNEAYRYLFELVHPPVWKAVAKVTVPIVLVGSALGGWAWATREVSVPTVSQLSSAGTDLATEPLYLGPQRASAQLELGGDVPSGTNGAWSVRRVTDGAESTVWSAAWSAPGLVTLEAAGERSEGRVAERVELVLGKDTLRSSPVELTWIGSGAWEVDEVLVGERPVEDLRGIGVDPYDTKLDLWMSGEARGDLERVSVRAGDGESYSLSLGTSSGERSRYRLELGDADLEDGRNELVLEVLDRSGKQWSRTVELEVLRDAPRWEQYSIVDASGERDENGDWPQANKLLGSFVVTPRTHPTLLLGLSRPADVSWKVFVEGSDLPQMQGSALGKRKVEGDLAGLDQLNGGEPFRGRIELTAREDSYVLHAPGSGRGVLTQEVPFSFEDTLPTFEAQWRGSGTLQNLGPENPVFTNATKTAVVVTRTQPVPMRVELSWWPTARPQEVQTTDSLELYNPQTQQTFLPVSLTEDGEWTLRLRSYRYDTAAKIVGDRPDIEVTRLVVLDRTAPRLVLDELRPDLIFTDPGQTPDLITVQLADLSGFSEPDVDLHWELAQEGQENPRSTFGSLLAHDPRGQQAQLELNGFLRDESADLDGSYQLVLAGSDGAGNSLPETRVDFEVSLHGPQIALAQPNGLGKWYPDPRTKRWTVRAQVSDANGIDRVFCELISGESKTAIRLEAEAGSTDSRRALVGSIALPHTMSEARVKLAFQAGDVRGSRSSWTSDEFELPTIARPAPGRIAITLGSAETESMRLVRGNQGLQYLFGGRGDEVENPDFVRAGLGTFNAEPRRSRSRSWKIPILPGAIEDYYLDEHEVSASQFLDFLRAPSGYSNPVHWPQGAKPDYETKSRLIDELELRAGDLPATDVTWNEAYAYAHWLDKRLPTWVEWEYAVRGGAEYRPHSSYDRKASAPIAMPSYAMEAAAPCGSGDWTPDGHFADLCGNVAEWTATGLPATSQETSYPHQWAMQEPERLLTHDAISKEYWIVGGHFGAGRIDFAVADFRASVYRDPTVGFRCAASLTHVQDRLGISREQGANFMEFN